MRKQWWFWVILSVLFWIYTILPWSHDWYFLYQFTDSVMTTNCTLACYNNSWHLDIDFVHRNRYIKKPTEQNGNQPHVHESGRASPPHSTSGGVSILINWTATPKSLEFMLIKNMSSQDTYTTCRAHRDYVLTSKLCWRAFHIFQQFLKSYS